MIKHCPICNSTLRLNRDTQTWECQKCPYTHKPIVKIEEPMNMNYRESYAWALGLDNGFKAGKEVKNNG